MKLITKFIIFLVVLGSTCYSQTDNSDIANKGSQELSYGLYLLKNDDTKKAEEIFKNHLESLNSPSEKREAYYRISKGYNTSLYFDLSILYAEEGLKVKSPNNYFSKELYQIISNNHIDLKNFKLAKEYYIKSTKSTQEGKPLVANDFNLMGEILRLSGKHKESLTYFQKAIKQSIKNGKEIPLATYYNNIGLSYLELNKLDSSQLFLDASLQIIDKQNLINRKSAINISFGKLSLKRNNLLKALSFYEKTITYDLSSHPDQYEVYLDAYNGMWKCYHLLGLNKKALLYYQEYHKYESKILNFSKQTIIFQNQILNERNNHKIQLEGLNRQIELEKKYNKVIIVLFGVALIIVILFLYVLWLRNKSIKQKVELVENNNRIQELEIERVKLSNNSLQAENLQNLQEQKIKDLESKRLKEQLDHKARQLTSTAIHILNKNEILSDISMKASELKEIPANELDKAIERIKYLIKDNLQFDNDWDIFKKHFTEVHPDFFITLLNKFPELTPDELKLCAYLKIQLSSKEIARLINITVEAVNKRRNRLRKKFSISPSHDLHDFILDITSTPS